MGHVRVLRTAAWWHSGRVRQGYKAHDGDADLICRPVLGIVPTLHRVRTRHGLFNNILENQFQTHNISKPTGTVLCAPPCSSWGFLNSFTYGRHISVFGHMDSHDVRANNLIASAVAMLIYVASIRGVYYIVEQPRPSQFFAFPSMDLAIQLKNSSGLSTFTGMS